MRKIDLNNFRVATSETARDINRRIVLNLIRKHQPVSRADLARHSGLQRSTVSAITEQLIAERWVMEGAAGHLPRGRRPTFLHLNAERAGIVGVTIRPMGTTIVLARLDTSFLAQSSMATDGNAEEFVNRLTRRVSELVKSHPEISFEGIGISVPGRIDERTHRLVFAPNLKWRNLDLKGPLEQATGLPVAVENAANACALAELWCGRHSESIRNLIAVTVAEGIGVGMILNGQLVRGTTGMAGEFGHVSLNEDGPICNCGNRGCWEAYASDQAAIRYYCESGPPADGNGGERTAAPLFADLLRLARQGDARAGAALDRMAHYLGLGLAMLISGFSPDAIVITGDVTEAWDRVEPILIEVVRNRCPVLSMPRIQPTDPATQPRLRGSIALFLQQHFGVPQGL
ncbi:MAG: ROK family transcriptional regulator [Verrucomicrobiota bacterium]